MPARTRSSGPTGARGRRSATAVVEAYVFDDPEDPLRCQVSGTAGLVATNIGNTANLLIGTGSSPTGTEADQVDQSTLSIRARPSATAGAQHQRLCTNNTYGQYARALVSIFLHY